MRRERLGFLLITARKFNRPISRAVAGLAAALLMAPGVCRGIAVSKNEAAHPSTHTGGLQPGSPWPMLLHDPMHTGRGIGKGAKGVLMWKYRCGDEIDSGPAISSDGTIYVGSDDGNLYAINPNGTLKWKYKTEGGAPVVSSPAIGSDGTIYVGSDDGNLYAINPRGTLKWKYKTEG